MGVQNSANLKAIIRPSVEKVLSQAIPKTQRAAVAIAHGGKVEIKTSEPVREPGPEDVLVHVVKTGTCHTDLHALSGDWELKSKMPLIAGHEGAGYIVKLGEQVKNFKPGDRVGIKWIHYTCGICEFCLSGRETVCPNQETSGFSVDGSFQEYAVAKARHVVPLPEGLSYDQAAPILCAGLTVYRGLKETEVKPGQWVVISGAGGGLGHLAVQYAKAMGMRVAAIDAGSKREFCESLGVDAFFDFKSEKNISQAILDTTHGGAHGALLAVANPEPYQQALGYLRTWGTLVTLGLPKRGSAIPVDIFDAVMRRLTVRGSIVGSRIEAIEALQFAARGAVKVHLEVRPLSKLQDVLDSMAKGEIKGRIVLDTSK
ncbi:hypothetical protein SpCBS45565_g08142 [Spizellomyces sp. 'palustris']|nr:hypothetical protein SpCBS45565_g08142 [Spizellomyces sp. 'palustris']